MGSKPGRRIYRYVDFEAQLLPLNIFILAGLFLFSQSPFAMEAHTLRVSVLKAAFAPCRRV
jgi:hypothetical protein